MGPKKNKTHNLSDFRLSGGLKTKSISIMEQVCHRKLFWLGCLALWILDLGLLEPGSTAVEYSKKKKNRKVIPIFSSIVTLLEVGLRVYYWKGDKTLLSKFGDKKNITKVGVGVGVERHVKRFKFKEYS